MPVDLRERQPVRDETVERQATRAVDGERGQEVPLGTRGAVDRAEDAPLHPRNRARRHGQHRVLARDPDQDRGAAIAGREDGRLHRLSLARRLDRVVDAAAADLADGVRRRFRAPGPDDAARGAERLRRVDLGLRHVDGDHRLGTDGNRRHQGGEADAAAADHGDPVARPDGGRLPDGADTGRDRAADEGRDVEGDIVRDPNARALGNDAGLGERREEAVVVDALTVAREPARAVHQAGLVHHRPYGRAQLREVANALRALAARRRPRERDVIARRNPGHADADCLDDARALVPEDDGAR